MTTGGTDPNAAWDNDAQTAALKQQAMNDFQNGLDLCNKKQYPQAIKIFENVLGLQTPDGTPCLDPLDRGLVQEYLGYAYQEGGNYDSAIRVFKQAIADLPPELDINARGAYYLWRLGDSQEHKGSHAEAVNSFEQALAFRRYSDGVNPFTAEEKSNIQTSLTRVKKAVENPPADITALRAQAAANGLPSYVASLQAHLQTTKGQ